MRIKLRIVLSVIVLVLGIVCANWYYNALHTPKKIKESNNGELDKFTERVDLQNLGLKDFETKLPIVYIDTDNKLIQKETKTESIIAMKNSDGTEHSVLGSPDEAYYAMVNYRGSSSFAGYEKKSYRVNFYKNTKYKKELEVDFLGLGKNSDWVLNGPYLDKTLIRNKLSYDLAREMMEWAPNTQFCELVVNGKYQGVYLAVEPVTNGERRLRLSEYGLLSGQTAFIAKRDRGNTEKIEINTYGKEKGKTQNAVFITYPKASRITDNQIKWINNRINQFEMALYSDDFEKNHNYLNYINIDSFVDYYILNEFSLNYDAGNLSTYLYEELNGKMSLAVWDFNNAYDNYQGKVCYTNQFYVSKNTWFKQLVKDRYFVDKVVERYQELRGTTLSESHLTEMMSDYHEYLGDAIDRNFDVWGFSFNLDLLTGIDENGEDRDISSYNDAVNQLENVINDRLLFLDEHITDLYDGVIN